MKISHILKEYEDIGLEKENIIKTISGLDAADEQQAKILDRIYRFLNQDTVGNNINKAFIGPMADEYMPDKSKENHRIELTKIISTLDSSYSAMGKFLDKLEKGGVVNIEELSKPVNSFNAGFGGDPVAISAFNNLKTYGVGQNQKGPGEFALAMLSNKSSLAKGEGDTEIDGVGKVEVKAAVGKSGAGGRLGHGGAQQDAQMATLQKFGEKLPNTINRITSSAGGSIGIKAFVDSLKAELPANTTDNKQLRVNIATQLIKPNFGTYADPIAKLFANEDANAINEMYVRQNFEWYKNRDGFDAYLLISFTRQKTGMGRTGDDIVTLRKTGQITDFGISMIPTKSGPREQFAQITMSAAGV